MTPEQKLLVQTTFAKVLPISEVAARLFYGRLFELDPELKRLFSGDMEEQGRKLMTMLQVAVKGLDRIEEIVPAIQALGRRHAAYGVTAADYAPVGAALLWTLEQGLEEAFTPEVELAWAEAYTLLAGVMKEASASAEAA